MVDSTHPSHPPPFSPLTTKVLTLSTGSFPMAVVDFERYENRRSSVSSATSCMLQFATVSARLILNLSRCPEGSPSASLGDLTWKEDKAHHPAAAITGAESDVENEFEDGDDQDGRTERFVRGLENDFSPAITQDVVALKWRRAEELALGDTFQSSQGNRLSLIGGKWDSSRFDPFKTQESDIKIAIRQMTEQKQQQHQQQQQQQQQQHEEQHRVEEDSSTPRRTSYGHLRSSLGRTSIGSFSSVRGRYGNEEVSHGSVRRTHQDYEESPLTMFKESTGNTVPMLEGEAPPPAYLDKDAPI
ncbi:MAG: hypothetical protein J3R72DRAFT_492885 [Linnemannia gamsii]|nr:MAG: hypothetical protein J3R72DRAFT_492885 [Linnemannia gamsii]